MSNQTDTPFHTEASHNDDSSTMTTLIPPVLPTAVNVWTKSSIFHVSALSVLMLLTLLGNATLIAVITSRAELRYKRANIFLGLLNLAVGDLLVCFVTMMTEIAFVAFGQWVLGNFACKLVVYGQIFTLSSTTFLLTAMSVDRYQVRVTMNIVVNVITDNWFVGCLKHNTVMILATRNLIV